MTNSTRKAASLLAGLCLLPLPSFAHHAAQVTYHTDQIIEVEGEITSLVWRNPHIRFTMNVTDAQGGAALWDVESIPVTRLKRVGVSADLVAVGQTVRVAGFPSRRSATEVYALNLLLADGREALLDTPVARWTDNTVGTGQDETPGERSADASLGLFRVWSTDGVPIPLGSLVSNETFKLTEEAQAAEAAWDTLSPDNPFRGCSPKGMPTIMEQPYPMELIDNGNTITMHMEEGDTVRVFDMTPIASAADKGLQPLGYSVGEWQDEVLVITTVGSDWPYVDMTGIPNSDDAVYVERFTAGENGTTLDYTLTITDPSTFTSPPTFTKTYLWLADAEVRPYDCEAREIED